MPKKVNHHRIFFLGDSTGQGIKMKVEGLLPTYLESALKKYPGLEDMEVINPSQVASAPADKLTLLAGFMDYDTDLFVIPLHHRMLSKEHFRDSPSLYPLIIDIVSEKYPDIDAVKSLKQYAPIRTSLTELSAQHVNFAIKKAWKFYSIAPLIHGWAASDDFEDLARAIAGRPGKRKSSWVEKAEKGTFTKHRLDVAVAYLDDYTPSLQERQVPYLRELVRFVKASKLPVFLYISPTNMGFIRHSAEGQGLDPEPQLEMVRKGIAIVKSVLEEEGASGFPILTDAVGNEGYSDGDHMLPAGNKVLAEKIAEYIAPIILEKEKSK
jgi:hypothetical protein